MICLLLPTSLVILEDFSNNRVPVYIVMNVENSRGGSVIKQKENSYTIFKLNVDREYEECRTETHFSPCGKLVATVCDASVHISRIYTDYSQEIFSHSCVFRIEDVKWSPSSVSLLLASFTECRVEIVRLDDHKWLHQIQTSQECGMAAAMWMPDNQHILTVSELSIHSLVHSVKGGSPQALPGIVCSRPGHPLLQFSPDGLYMAFVQPSSTGYYVVLFSVISCSILWRRQPNCVVISGMLWSPDSYLLAIWDSPRRMCIHIFDLNGSCIRTLTTSDPTGLGVATLTMSHCTQMMASVLAGNEIQVFNMLNWQLCEILSPVDGNILEYAQTKGILIKIPGSTTGTSASMRASKSIIAFSSCGHYLASTVKSSNSMISVWNIQDGCVLSCLLQLNSCVSGLAWNTYNPYLVVTDGSNTLVTWSAPSKILHKETSTVVLVNTSLDSVASIQWVSKSKLAIVSCMGKTAILSLKRHSRVN